MNLLVEIILSNSGKLNKIDSYVRLSQEIRAAGNSHHPYSPEDDDVIQSEGRILL